MTGRHIAWLLALCAVAGGTRAEEPRGVPALGSKLTYRLVTTTTTPTRTTTVGEVYTYIVTASDATSAEGVIKPRALIVHCDGGSADPGCSDARKATGAHFDGDLLTVPIASDIGDSLARHSHFKLTHFFMASRQFPVPGARDKDVGLAEIGPEPSMVLTNTLQCDLSGLAAFLPVGNAPHIALPCENIFERSASRDGRTAAQTNRDKVSFDITCTGSGWVSLPSGNWEVKKLAFKMMPADPTHGGSEGENLFSAQLGALVRTHLIGRNPAANSTTENTVDLIAVKP